MTILNDLLQQRPGLSQPPRQFLATLCVTILVLRGRVHCRTLSRYGTYAERTSARQVREPLDWPDFQQRVRLMALDPRAERVAAPDAACIPQRGKPTVGLGPCCNGWASRAERGRELSTLAVVEVPRRCAFTRAVAQTPPGEAATPAEPEDPRGDCSKQQRRAHRHRLPSSIRSPGVAGD